jgi:hypothetical protein
MTILEIQDSYPYSRFIQNHIFWERESERVNSYKCRLLSDLFWSVSISIFVNQGEPKYVVLYIFKLHAI